MAGFTSCSGSNVRNLVYPRLSIPLWQVAQPVVMPVWFIAPVLKVVVDLWHVSQAAVVTMCDAWFTQGCRPVMASRTT